MSGYLYVTPRTLLGIIRLAQAHARLRLKDEVSEEDIDEAIRLMDASKDTINDQSKKDSKFFISNSPLDLNYDKDPMSIIFSVIKEMCVMGKKGINTAAID